jgi:hypothetical protein
VGISHEVLAVGAAFAVIVGVQLVMFGVLSDMILAINREQTRRFEGLVANARWDSPTTEDEQRTDGTRMDGRRERVSGRAGERD